ncbi:4331_t:CDS:1, partial [Paraglomus occultum]
LSSGLYLPNIETISNAALAASSAARITTAASNFSPLRASCTSSAVPTPTRPSPSTTPVHQFSSTPTSPKAGSSGVAPMEIVCR